MVLSRATQSGIKINKNAMETDTRAQNSYPAMTAFGQCLNSGPSTRPHSHQKPSRLAFIQGSAKTAQPYQPYWQSLLVKSRKNVICISVRLDAAGNVHLKKTSPRHPHSLWCCRRVHGSTLYRGRFVETQLLPGKLTHGDFTRRCKAVLLRSSFHVVVNHGRVLL